MGQRGNSVFDKLIAKIAGKYIANKLKLEDGPLNESKPWYKSKTIWAAVYVILRGAYEGVRTMILPNLPEIPPMVDSIVSAVAGVQVVRSRIAGPDQKPIG